MPSLSLSSGVIRAARAVLTGSCSDASPDEFDIVVIGPGEQELSRTWLREASGGEGASDGKANGEFRAEVSLDGLSAPIRRIEVQSRTGNASVTALPGYQLGNLFFETDAQFEESAAGKRRKARPADKETDCFFSRQLAMHFPGERGHRILMAISYCYRATELLNTADMERSLAILDECRELLREMATSNRRFRLDRTHLHFSMLTARWHAELALGRVAAFEETLERLLRDAPMSATSDQCFVTSYNLVRGLLVLVIHRGRQGRPAEALEALRVAQKVLQWAAYSLGEGDLLREFGSTCALVAATAPIRKSLSNAVRATPQRSSSGAAEDLVALNLVRRCIRTSNVEQLLPYFVKASQGRTDK